MPSIEFAWKPDAQSVTVAEGRFPGLRLSDTVLERNARWFITVRWVAVAVLVIVQTSAVYAGGVLARIGISVHGWWPASIAAILCCSNLLYFFSIHQHRVRSVVRPQANLWVQIGVDLICLTAVVHYCGSVATPAPFLYVLHIVLSCVFFSVRSSFAVAFAVTLLYLGAVTSELVEVAGRHNVFTALGGPAPLFGPAASICWAGTLSMLFLLVWYLVSQLSLVIRARETQLMDAHEQIRTAQEEKDRYAVQMTHQLKSPLDAMRSNIALVTGGYCGGVSDEVREVLARIDRRAQGMAGLIMDVLKLARVRASRDVSGLRRRADVGALLRRCADNLRPVAEARRIAFDLSVEPAEVECVPEQIEMLFENVVANAVAYSHSDQTVRISCGIDRQRQAVAATVADQGIGIEERSLPHIFDDYFRAPDAARHNSASSGIGLAIVKTVAQNHGLSIRVDSVHGCGCTFTIVFPTTGDDASVARDSRTTTIEKKDIV